MARSPLSFLAVVGATLAMTSWLDRARGARAVDPQDFDLLHGYINSVFKHMEKTRTLGFAWTDMRGELELVLDEDSHIRVFLTEKGRPVLHIERQHRVGPWDWEVGEVDYIRLERLTMLGREPVLTRDVNEDAEYIAREVVEFTTRHGMRLP